MIRFKFQNDLKTRYMNISWLLLRLIDWWICPLTDCSDCALMLEFWKATLALLVKDATLPAPPHVFPGQFQGPEWTLENFDSSRSTIYWFYQLFIIPHCTDLLTFLFARLGYMITPFPPLNWINSTPAKILLSLVFASRLLKKNI